ncbi:MAG: regulatory protein GemA [Rhodobacterales bacterium]|nr:regulatory protein GemA [Rhodobacterales bacterium]
MTASRSLQRTIHVACKDLGLDDEARRDLQLAATGKASMRDMTEADLRLVIDKLKAAGFTLSPTPRKAAPRADLRLIHVLWAKLAEKGVLERPGRDGLNAFIRSRFEAAWGSVPADIDMLRDHEKIDAVIEALKQWGRRAGIDFNWKGRPK